MNISSTFSRLFANRLMPALFFLALTVAPVAAQTSLNYLPPGQPTAVAWIR
jgi:hypothetical protein